MQTYRDWLRLLQDEAAALGDTASVDDIDTVLDDDTGDAAYIRALECLMGGRWTDVRTFDRIELLLEDAVRLDDRVTDAALAKEEQQEADRARTERGDAVPGRDREPPVDFNDRPPPKGGW